MQIRDRVKELRRVKAGDLRPSPRNWRTHPQGQREALQGILAEIGYADALLARELPDGSLELVDGHLRAETTPDMEVPVLVLDLSEAEAGKLDALLRDVETDSEALAKLLDDLAADSGILTNDSGDVELRQLDTRPPPKMTWALVGIPTVRFGEIAATIEGLAAIPGIVLETTSNDG